MPKFELSENGINKLQKHVEKIANATNKSYTFSELFTDSFMQAHTRHNSISAFLDNCGFPWAAPEEFRAIPDDAFDAYVSKNSDFSNWKEMKEVAAKELLHDKLKP